MENLDYLKELTNRELLELYQKKKELEVKQELTLRYLYLVKMIAIQMRNVYAGSLQMEDIINEGVIAIMKGIDRYDITRDNKFETYISQRLRGMIIDMIRKNDWIPKDSRRQSKAIESARNEMFLSLGRPPTDEELAERVHMDIKKFRKLQDTISLMNVLSLDMVLEDNEDSQSLQPVNRDISSQPEEAFLKGETSRILEEAIESLEEREKLVISLYYVEKLSMRQIAQVLDVSQPRVSQLHSAAIRKLKNYMDTYYF